MKIINSPCGCGCKNCQPTSFMVCPPPRNQTPCGMRHRGTDYGVYAAALLIKVHITRGKSRRRLAQPFLNSKDNSMRLHFHIYLICVRRLVSCVQNSVFINCLFKHPRSSPAFKHWFTFHSTSILFHADSHLVLFEKSQDWPVLIVHYTLEFCQSRETILFRIDEQAWIYDYCTVGIRHNNSIGNRGRLLRSTLESSQQRGRQRQRRRTGAHTLDKHNTLSQETNCTSRTSGREVTSLAWNTFP